MSSKVIASLLELHLYWNFISIGIASLLEFLILREAEYVVLGLQGDLMQRVFQGDFLVFLFCFLFIISSAW